MEKLLSNHEAQFISWHIYAPLAVKLLIKKSVLPIPPTPLPLALEALWPRSSSKENHYTAAGKEAAGGGGRQAGTEAEHGGRKEIVHRLH